MIAPSNQMLTQGGILSRDWFSDRLAVRNSDIQMWVLRDSRRLCQDPDSLIEFISMKFHPKKDLDIKRIRSLPP